jgi:mRNA-degrading endonuclease RelE of RelBE toxin-antitoxin system
MFRLFTTEEFDQDYAKLDNSDKLRVDKILKQLKEKGDNIGKYLAGLSFFREKKFDGKRLYFLVYKSINTIFVIAISDKKAQQSTINQILQELSEYQHYIFELIKRNNV